MVGMLDFLIGNKNVPELHCSLKRPQDDVLVTGEPSRSSHNSPWLTWRSLNRLRTGYTCSKEQRKKWKYYDGDTTCVCGLATENTAHLLQCSLLTRPCTLDDLLEFNDTGRECAERWKKTV